MSIRGAVGTRAGASLPPFLLSNSSSRLSDEYHKKKDFQERFTAPADCLAAIPSSIPMRVDEYCRLHAVCLDMAMQSSVPEVKTRWLTMAAVCLKLAMSDRKDDGEIDYSRNRKAI
jgi:hypothetical protein